MSYSVAFFGLVALTALVAGFAWTVGSILAAKVLAKKA